MNKFYTWKDSEYLKLFAQLHKSIWDHKTSAPKRLHSQMYRHMRIAQRLFRVEVKKQHLDRKGKRDRLYVKLIALACFILARGASDRTTGFDYHYNSEFKHLFESKRRPEFQALIDSAFPKVKPGVSGRRLAKREVNTDFFSHETLNLLAELTGHRFKNVRPRALADEQPPPHGDEDYPGEDTRFGGDLIEGTPPDPTPQECRVFADEPLILQKDLDALHGWLEEALEPSPLEQTSFDELWRMYKLLAPDPIEFAVFQDHVNALHDLRNGVLVGVTLTPNMIRRSQERAKAWIEENRGWREHIRGLKAEPRRYC